MTFRLTCQTPSKTRRWLVHTGESACVGASMWADFQVVDGGLESEHFKIAYTDSLRIESVGSATFSVHGQLVTTYVLDRSTSIQVGSATFLFEPLFPPEFIDDSDADNEDLHESSAPQWPHKQELIGHIKLSNEGAILIQSIETPSMAIDSIRSHGLDEDTVRLLAGILPYPRNIEWCFEALMAASLLDSPDLISEIRCWLDQPDEANRVRVESKVDWSQQSSPSTWILAAIAWSKGLPESANNESLAPAIKMIISAIITSLQLASTLRDRQEFRRSCIELGTKFLAAPQGPRS